MDAENLIREQYTPYMQKKYGDDLLAVTEFDEYTLGGRPVSAALYTYKLQGYLIDMIRAYENVNGHTVSYTAKYIQGQGEATLAAWMPQYRITARLRTTTHLKATAGATISFRRKTEEPSFSSMKYLSPFRLTGRGNMTSKSMREVFPSISR